MKIINDIICDDIRYEEQGKISLMGIYEKDITFNVTPDKKGTWPKHFTFAIFLRCRLDEKDLEKGITSISLSIKQGESKKTLGKQPITHTRLQKGMSLTFAAKFVNHEVLDSAPLTGSIIFYDKDDNVVEELSSDNPVTFHDVVIQDPLNQ